MANELFRQDGKSKGERAIVQGDDPKRGLKASEGHQISERPETEKHEGPVVGVDTYHDRFERVNPGRREYHQSDFSASTVKLANHSTAAALKAEIDEIVALKPMTWDLPVWRSAQLGDEILKRLTDTVDQLKVVMRASDSLGGEVEALYELKNPVTASDAQETTEETKDE